MHKPPYKEYLFLLVVLLAAFSAAAVAAESCAVCHRYEGLTADGRPLWLHRESVGFSAHKALFCSDCHKGYSGYPHQPGGQARCDLACHVPGANHEAVQAAVKSGPHAKLAGERSSSCVSCHKDVIADKEDTTDKSCVKCHGPKDDGDAPFPDTAGSFGRRAHKVAGKAAKAPTCVDCHGAHKADVETARASCAKPGCHQGKPADFAFLYDHGRKAEGSGKPWFSWLLVVLAGLALAVHVRKG